MFDLEQESDKELKFDKERSFGKERKFDKDLDCCTFIDYRVCVRTRYVFFSVLSLNGQTLIFAGSLFFQYRIPPLKKLGKQPILGCTCVQSSRKGS